MNWKEFSAEVVSGDADVSPWCASQVRQLTELGPEPAQWPKGDSAALPPAAQPLATAVSRGRGAAYLASAYDPVGKHRDDPWPLFARLATEEPVSWCDWLEAWVVAGYDANRTIMGDPETFSSRYSTPMHVELQPAELRTVLADMDPLGNPIVSSDHWEHRLHRAVWQEFFHGKIVGGLEQHVWDTARALADDLAVLPSPDVVRDFAQPLVLRVVGRLMGFDTAETLWHYQRAMHVVEWATPWLPMDTRLAAARDTVAANHRYRELYAQLCAADTEPTISSMAAHLSYDHWRTVVLLGWTAAVDTTVGAITGAVYHLLSRNRWQDAHPDSLPAMIEESIRLDTPHRGLLRTVTTPIRLYDQELAEGDRVLLLFGAANRDPAAFAAPHEFRPERNDQAVHIGFGHGVHGCVGARLARMETRVALRVLTERFPHATLPTNWSPRYSPSMFFRLLDELPVALTPPLLSDDDETE
ncbi:cytochrome P450 [Saccharopolyspora sp. K220]|uniref:cytochrome P450 n=1 Tax=Saccharopolyspora soli TaxID=2926618 RepID=UPI001F5A3289|nr:cytochrome P450 [Saccharopolyspora soli]MCI2422869.1 cytochrome P450 [Saccharopolyspora soli]